MCQGSSHSSALALLPYKPFVVTFLWILGEMGVFAYILRHNSAFVVIFRGHTQSQFSYEWKICSKVASQRVLQCCS